MFEVDPSFRKGGAQARLRRRRRLIRRAAIGGGGALALAAVIGLGWLVAARGPADEPAATGQAAVAGGDLEETLVQSDGSDDGTYARNPRDAFIDLPRDPMILRLEQAGAQHVAPLEGSEAIPSDRAGPPAPDRLSLLSDALFVGENRLVLTLPSSRHDFALFQAERARAFAEPEGTPRPAVVAEPAAPGTLVTVEGESSFGSFIAPAAGGEAGRGDEGRGVAPGAAVFVETQIANTTSTAVALREDQRYPLFEDRIVVLAAERPLEQVLTSNGLDAAQAGRIVQGAARELGLAGPLAARSIVALRLRPQPGGARLMQMSVYGPEGYLASLAQIGAGRFSRAADPWLADDLLHRSDRIGAGGPAAQDVRLLDALYSAGIRNGMPTKLVGEMIALMAQRHDLDRFVLDGDRVRVLFATRPGPAGQGAGRLLFVGISGPSGKMACYVMSDPEGGFSCFDGTAAVASAPGPGRAGAGGIGAGMVVPVRGVPTSGFGPRLHPILKQVRNHDGQDWAAPIGTPVVAVAAGRIERIGNGGDYGNVVYIDHGNGLQTRYAHLNAFAPGLRTGSTVAAGQEIGQLGTSGLSTGPHLHFELRVNGVPADPMSYGGAGGGDAAVEALVARIIQVESGGNAAARNSRSTATGLGQFIEGTWLRMMGDYRPELARSMSREDLLALRTDPALSREMVVNLARENEAYLRARGHQITAGRLYLAHFLGPVGADRALAAAPEATVLEVLGGAVVGANPFLTGKTVAELRDWSDRKMGAAAAVGGGGGAVAAVRLSPQMQALRAAIDAALASAG